MPRLITLPWAQRRQSRYNLRATVPRDRKGSDMRRSLLLLAIVLLVPVAGHAVPMSAGKGTPNGQAAGQNSAAGVAAAEFRAGNAALRRGDYQRALTDWQLAAAQGNALAEFNLGWMYVKGQGVPQDFAKALKWYRLAAAQGYAYAELNLGVMYAKGQGVPQDFVKAYKWFLLSKATLPATVRDYPLATKYVEALAAQMTPAQIAQAQQEAAAWYAAHQHAGQ